MSGKLDDVLLVEQVERHPVIWDKNDKDYKDKTVQWRHWEEICKEQFPSLTAYELSSRFKSLRDRYVRELRTHGVVMSGGSPKAKSSWRLMKKMSYVMNQIIPRKTSGNSKKRTYAGEDVHRRQSPRLLAHRQVAATTTRRAPSTDRDTPSPQNAAAAGSPSSRPQSALDDYESMMESLQPDISNIVETGTTKHTSFNADESEPEEQAPPAKTMKVQKAKKSFSPAKSRGKSNDTSEKKEGAAQAYNSITSAMSEVRKMIANPPTPKSPVHQSANDSFGRFVATSISSLKPALQIEIRRRICEELSNFEIQNLQ